MKYEDGVLCKIEYPFETHFTLESREIAFAINNGIDKSSLAQSTVESLSCSVQNFKRLGDWNNCYGRTRFREIWV